MLHALISISVQLLGTLPFLIPLASFHGLSSETLFPCISPATTSLSVSSKTS
jgi:hypothetical protein